MGRPDFGIRRALLAATARPTVTIDAPMNSDVEALQEGLERIRELLASPSSDMNHDLLNLIGAIRGYAEMLYEDIALLHPALQRDPARRFICSRQHPADAGAATTDESSTTKTEAPGVILAVDDMPENRELISRLLSRAGHTVISAESGEEALELLETRGVDVVLLDLMMPGIGGSEVLRRMKEHDGLRATPVIMISGRQDMDQIVACIQSGADDYLLKPFNPVLLQARISAGSSASAGTTGKRTTDTSWNATSASSDRPLVVISQTTSLPSYWKRPRGWNSAVTCARSPS